MRAPFAYAMLGVDLGGDECVVALRRNSDGSLSVEVWTEGAREASTLDSVSVRAEFAP